MKEWANGVCAKYAVRPGFVTGVAKWTAVSGYEGQSRARMRSDSVETMFPQGSRPHCLVVCLAPNHAW